MHDPREPSRPFPADERLIVPGQRAELLRGHLLPTPAADEPHATSHFDLARLLGAHIADSHIAALNMLTRTAHDSDFAPDASVFPAARDDAGRRRLEELAFEITSEQSIGVPSEKARELCRRGVRRVFCIVREKARVLEWSRPIDGWQMLEADAVIEDPAFARPLPIRALVDAAERDQAIVAALLARGALRRIEDLRREEGREQGREQGRDQARRDVARELCAAFGIDLDAARAQHIDALDAAGLVALTGELMRTRGWPVD